ncbi:hypothetical protein KX816_10370 [Sphingosinicellaceae bacterium]|nr:hypothetical protein KX816_10370 [Sphingosinicellaceae bacterium]
MNDDVLTSLYPGSDGIVRVTASEIFVNCGRYIHQSQGSKLSAHVPDQGGDQPFPAWKRLDVFADALSVPDAQRVESVGGVISLEDYPGEADPDAASRPRP